MDLNINIFARAIYFRLGMHSKNTLRSVLSSKLGWFWWHVFFFFKSSNKLTTCSTYFTMQLRYSQTRLPFGPVPLDVQTVSLTLKGEPRIPFLRNCVRITHIISELKCVPTHSDNTNNRKNMIIPQTSLNEMEDVQETLYLH